MREIIQKVPIPAAGVALGLAALGNLLQPYGEYLHFACGICALVLVIMLGAKIILFPRLIREDLRNSIFASVSATLFMSLMQLATYLAPYAWTAAFFLWLAAVGAHIVLMIWFTIHFIARFKLYEVFPTYFICYVGIIVASVTSPIFTMQSVGLAFFWFGFACYLVLLCLVTYRYLKHEIPEAARPLFCIYAAPMSLSLAGYLAVSNNPNSFFVAVLLMLSQALYIMVLTRLPHLVRLQFYPSYAAMTFPFVISAVALGKALVFFRAQGLLTASVFDLLYPMEIGFAVVMVIYVVVHYVGYFARCIEKPQSAGVQIEQKQAAVFAEQFDN